MPCTSRASKSTVSRVSKGDYLSLYMSRQISKWMEEDGPADEEEGEDPTQDKQEGGDEKAATRPGSSCPQGHRQGCWQGPQSRRLVGRCGFSRSWTIEEQAEEAKRGELRERLDRVRDRLAGNPGSHAAPVIRAGNRAVHAVGDDDVCSVSSSPGYSASVGEELTVGNRLLSNMKGLEAREAGPSEPLRPLAGEAPQKKKKKKRKPAKENGLLAIKDGTMSGLQKQLVRRAAENAAQTEKKKKEEAKKSRPMNSGQKFLKILTDAIQPKKNKKKDRERGEKRKKKGKTKKHKRQIKKDPDGGSSPSGSSPTSSSEVDSEKDWEQTSTTSSEERYEPPLKRKSQQHPGSVLKLLVAHAREQLDQTSKVSVSRTDEDPTQGIKLASYYSIVLKPQLQGGSSVAALRELHLLSHGMDLLRSGQLDKLGDVMALRFIAVHQATIDGGWSAAKHLELLPMQDVSAVGTAVVLQARRHARIAAKALNPEVGAWKGGSKGKGGKAKAGFQDDWRYEGKGKTKKGEKGRGKGKGWWGQASTAEGGGQGCRQEEGEARRKALKRKERGVLLDSSVQPPKKVQRALAFCRAPAQEDGGLEESRPESALTSFKDVVSRCCSFRAVGVALAWWTFAGVASRRAILVLQVIGWMAG